LTTTHHVRLEHPDRTSARCRCVSVSRDVGRSSAPQVPRTITSEQLDQAVRQLRERPGRPAAEQMQAVLRALDLTVAPRNEHRR
jgi:hypothetical protein